MHRGPDIPHVPHDEVREPLVGEHVVAPREELHLVGGAGHLVGAVGDLEDPVVDVVHLLPLRGPDVEPCPGVGGDDVGLAPAHLGDVVDPGLLDDVLPHEVDAVAHELHRVEGADPVLGVPRGVGCLPVEVELDAVHRVAATSARGVSAAGMVAETGVDPVEVAVPDQPDLPDEGLLGGAAVELDGPGDVVGLHRGLEGDGPGEPRGAVDVVAAAVAGPPLDDGVLVGHRLLGDSCQGVELPHHPDGGAPAAPGGHEGRGHAGDAPLDAEALLLDRVREELGGLVL